jgi:hypothetical protein
MMPCRHARKGHRAMVVDRDARPQPEDGAMRSHKGDSVNCTHRLWGHLLALAGQWLRGWEVGGNVGGGRETAGRGHASPERACGEGSPNWAPPVFAQAPF